MRGGKVFFRGVRAMQESNTYLAILEEGEAKATREAIPAVGEEQLGRPDESIQHQLSSVTDLVRLKHMVRRAVKAASWKEIFDTPSSFAGPRRLGLPVPDYAIVNIPQKLLSTIASPEIRDLLTKNLGDNFGVEYCEGYDAWRPATKSCSDDFLNGLEEVLSFDATVMNGDRKAGNSNLLRRGEEWFLIDHSLALPVDAWPAGECPLYPDAEAKAHCAYPLLYGKGRQYENLTGAWQQAITPTELAGLRSFVPPLWESKPGDLDRIFDFLAHRPNVFNDLSAALRRVVL
jgi:hypothetical protein